MGVFFELNFSSRQAMVAVRRILQLVAPLRQSTVAPSLLQHRALMGLAQRYVAESAPPQARHLIVAEQGHRSKGELFIDRVCASKREHFGCLPRTGEHVDAATSSGNACTSQQEAIDMIWSAVNAYGTLRDRHLCDIVRRWLASDGVVTTTSVSSTQRPSGRRCVALLMAATEAMELRACSPRHDATNPVKSNSIRHESPLTLISPWNEFWEKSILAALKMGGSPAHSSGGGPLRTASGSMATSSLSPLLVALYETLPFDRLFQRRVVGNDDDTGLLPPEVTTIIELLWHTIGVAARVLELTRRLSSAADDGGNHSAAENTPVAGLGVLRILRADVLLAAGESLERDTWSWIAMVAAPGSGQAGCPQLDAADADAAAATCVQQYYQDSASAPRRRRQLERRAAFIVSQFSAALATTAGSQPRVFSDGPLGVGRVTVADRRELARLEEISGGILQSAGSDAGGPVPRYS